jgi:hypothetical protein
MKYPLIILSLLIISCTTEVEKNTADKVILSETAVTETEQIIEAKPINSGTDNYSAKTTVNVGSHGHTTWGYQILNNGNLYINQPHIPSIQGNNGFETEEKSITTANYIIYKLNNGLFPPTISKEELDSLGVL